MTHHAVKQHAGKQHAGKQHAGRLTFLTVFLMSLAACGSGQQHTEQLLDQRLHYRLASEVASGQAVVQKLQSGDRVTLLGLSTFTNSRQALDNQAPDVRANVIEALLDPRLMQVQVDDSSVLPVDQRDARVQNMMDYFAANGLGSVVVPAGSVAGGAAPADAGPPGLVLTISVACPPGDWFIGYRDGSARPNCD
jgi:hypothetical protein